MVGDTENKDILGISLKCFSAILMAGFFAHTAWAEAC